MRSIDIHAHNVPRSVVNIRDGGDWHGFTVQKGGPVGRLFLTRGQDRGWLHPMMLWTTEERLMDMDSKGVDVHVLSTWVGLYNYHLDAAIAQATSRDCNDDIAAVSKAYPSRFAGLATLPMQDVGMAVAELERCMAAGFKGCMINDHVNGRTLDEPEFLPFWAAAERTGALVCFHQENDTLVSARSDGKYHLHNSIGNLADRALTFALLVFGGVMDRFPDLKVLLMHGGGYTCFGLGRMDRGWQTNPYARANISKPPSTYAKRFYYDCLIHSEQSLRFILDTVGPDRVTFGTDWPFNMDVDWPVSWIMGMESLSTEEKEAILWKNLQKLLNI